VRRKTVHHINIVWLYTCAVVYGIHCITRPIVLCFLLCRCLSSFLLCHELCYSKTTVYYEIHERSECISVDCGLTNLIHDRRSCVDFTLSGSVIGRLHIRIYSRPIRVPLNIDPSSLLRLNARRIYI